LAQNVKNANKTFSNLWLNKIDKNVRFFAKKNWSKFNQVHHDLIKPIHALFNNRMLGKYWQALSSKMSTVALLNRHYSVDCCKPTNALFVNLVTCRVD